MEHLCPEIADYNHHLILQAGVKETNLVFQIITGNLIAQEEPFLSSTTLPLEKKTSPHRVILTTSNECKKGMALHCSPK